MTFKPPTELVVGDWFIDPQRQGGRPAMVVEIRDVGIGEPLFQLADDTPWRAWSAAYGEEEQVAMVPPEVAAVLDVLRQLAGHYTKDVTGDAWQDVIEQLDMYDPAGTRRDADMFALTDGTVIRLNRERQHWRVIDAAGVEVRWLDGTWVPYGVR